MRVVLQVTDGPHKGQTRVLHTDQSLSVGRSDWAGFCCNLDESLSRMHFEIKIGHKSCSVIDKNSRNGTRVNGQPIQEVQLANGDEIQAGKSKFRMQFSSEVSLPDTTPHPLTMSNSDPSFEQGLNGRLSASYEKKALPSGWMQCSGSSEEVKASTLANLLQASTPVYLLYDPNKAGVPAPDGDHPYLFGHLPTPVCKAISPVFLVAAQLPKWRDLIDEAWGTNSVVILFSGSKPADLLAGLQKAARGGDGQSVNGIGWPGVLAAILSSINSDALDDYVPNVTSVLLEKVGSPERWQLFSREPIDEKIRKFGFKVRVLEAFTTEMSVINE